MSEVSDEAIEGFHAQVITEDDVAAAKAAMAAEDGTAEEPAEEQPPAEEAEGGEAPTEEPKLELDESEPAEEAAEETPAELIDMAQITQNFDDSGELDADTRQMLVDALSTKFANADALVDQFIAGQLAARETAQSAAFNLVGGAENYSAMQTWASENLSAEQKSAFNQALNTPGMSQMAIQGLYAQYSQATGAAGVTPQRVAPTGNVVGGVKPLTSIQQIAEMTADPRFDRDPAFRQEVERRIAAGMKR
jgi:hypothetical protein